MSNLELPPQAVFPLPDGSLYLEPAWNSEGPLAGGGVNPALDAAFDDITSLAARLCRVPIARIDLVDRVGPEFKTSPESAFCAHALSPPGPFIVRDASADERFPSAARTAAGPAIRFYAGAPLILSDGRAEGTLSVIDHVPRELSPDQADSLRALARLAVGQIELHRSLVKGSGDTRRRLRAEQEYETICSTVAHNLPAPLRAIQGMSQALREDCSDRLSVDGRNYLDRIAEAARRMSDQIQALLAYSRVCRVDPRIGPCDLDPVIDGAVAGLQAEFRARDAEVTVDRPLPRVAGDRVILDLIAGNLLSNAVKFTAPGVPPRVRVRAEVSGRVARLWVEDNGIGIAPEYQVRLFRVFERLHGSETGYPGLGVGLAIVRRAAERLGGRVGVESAPGRGSRFWVELMTSGAPSEG